MLKSGFDSPSRRTRRGVALEANIGVIADERTCWISSVAERFTRNEDVGRPIRPSSTNSPAYPQW
jgi:hypothetical protein